jgi:hypothetical protein
MIQGAWKGKEVIIPLMLVNQSRLIFDCIESSLAAGENLKGHDSENLEYPT